LHPRVTKDKAFKHLDGRVVLVGEFDVEAILAAVPERHRYARAALPGKRCGTLR
jgi:hypothetical protein